MGRPVRGPGKRRCLYGKTKKAAAGRLNEKMTSGVANLAAEAEKMRLGEFLDRWIPGVKETVRTGTFRRHEEVVRLHIKPLIGDVKLLKLNPSHPTGDAQPHGFDGSSHNPCGLRRRRRTVWLRRDDDRGGCGDRFYYLRGEARTAHHDG